MPDGRDVRARGAALRPATSRRIDPLQRPEVGSSPAPQTRFGVVRAIGDPPLTSRQVLIQRIYMVREDDGSATGLWEFRDEEAEPLFCEPDTVAIDYTQFVNETAEWIVRHQNKLRYLHPITGLQVSDCFEQPQTG